MSETLDRITQANADSQQHVIGTMRKSRTLNRHPLDTLHGVPLGQEEAVVECRLQNHHLIELVVDLLHCRDIVVPQVDWKSKDCCAFLTSDVILAVS